MGGPAVSNNAGAASADSFLMQQQRHIQSIVSSARPVGRGVAGKCAATSGQSAYGTENFMSEALRKIGLENRSPAYEPQQPHIPPDAFELQHAKASPSKTVVLARNRFRLMGLQHETVGMSKVPEAGRSTIDAWATAEMIRAKGLTQGALKKEWVGIKATVTNRDFLLAETLKYQRNLVAQREDARGNSYRGIKPQMPADAFVMGEQREKRSAINDANRLAILPAPQLGVDALLFDEYRKAQQMASEALRLTETVQVDRIEQTSRGGHPSVELTA